jgi:4'-phosphopantetheinyl transferase
VHLWPVRLDDSGWDAHAAVLSDGERDRAARFLRPADRCRFVRGHAALRCVLARYLDCAPHAVALTAGPYGKPGVVGEPLQFSFSHSHELAMVAVAVAAGVVGVDLEYAARPLPELDGMIGLVCHPEERTVLATLAPAARAAAVYRLWTRKEAYCKALGVGLRRALTGIRFGDDGRVADAALDQPDAFHVATHAWPGSYVVSLCAPAPPRYEVFQL